LLHSRSSITLLGLLSYFRLEPVFRGLSR
jgi:hypothetical protein